MYGRGWHIGVSRTKFDVECKRVNCESRSVKEASTYTCRLSGDNAALLYSRRARRRMTYHLAASHAEAAPTIRAKLYQAMRRSGNQCRSGDKCSIPCRVNMSSSRIAFAHTAVGRITKTIGQRASAGPKEAKHHAPSSSATRHNARRDPQEDMARQKRARWQRHHSLVAMRGYSSRTGKKRSSRRGENTVEVARYQRVFLRADADDLSARRASSTQP